MNPVESQQHRDDRLGEIMRESVTHVLAEGTEAERALILARVPYICADIKAIKEMLQKIMESQVYTPLVQKIVFGLVSLILIAVAVALVDLVILK